MPSHSRSKSRKEHKESLVNRLFDRSTEPEPRKQFKARDSSPIPVRSNDKSKKESKNIGEKQYQNSFNSFDHLEDLDEQLEDYCFSKESKKELLKRRAAANFQSDFSDFPSAHNTRINGYGSQNQKNKSNRSSSNFNTLNNSYNNRNDFRPDRFKRDRIDGNQSKSQGSTIKGSLKNYECQQPVKVETPYPTLKLSKRLDIFEQIRKQHVLRIHLSCFENKFSKSNNRFIPILPKWLRKEG